MAKKKKKGASRPAGFAAMSPAKFIREIARTLPIGDCYYSKECMSEGLTPVVVTRKRKSGNIVLGVYLVDTYCLGVKNVICNPNIPADEITETLDRIFGGQPYEQITYPEAHNLIYGSIAFAEEAGIEPHPDFALAQYVLEEDTDDIPLIEYEFGKDGKYLLIGGPSGREGLLVGKLKERLGDKFDYLIALDDDSDLDNGEENEEDGEEEYGYYDEEESSPKAD